MGKEVSDRETTGRREVSIGETMGKEISYGDIICNL